MEQKSMSDVLSRLAVLLRNHREQLVQDWSVRVRKDPTLIRASNFDDEELRDYIPKLLDDLIDALAKGSSGNGEQGVVIGSSEAAKAHVRHRFEQQFSLEDLLRELAHIRVAIINLAAQEDVKLAGSEAQLVHSAIDEVMNTAACAMAEMTSADLRRDVELRELFVAVLGHDLRTPITTIHLTMADLLKREDVPASLTRPHQRIARAADRMQRMVAELLDMTRIRVHEGMPIAPEPIALQSICEQMVEELGLKYADRTIVFNAFGNSQGQWDPVRMAQVVSNIIGNALGHSPPDTPVNVELRSEDDRVVLQVNNKGTPISPEEIAIVFKPFRYGTQDPPTTNRSEGLGLGLYIAKEIVKAHGGTIELTSNKHEGTTVTITLPRRT
jgi:signal transduction histidine kinase